MIGRRMALTRLLGGTVAAAVAPAKVVADLLEDDDVSGPEPEHPDAYVQPKPKPSKAAKALADYINRQNQRHQNMRRYGDRDHPFPPHIGEKKSWSTAFKTHVAVKEEDDDALVWIDTWDDSHKTVGAITKEVMKRGGKRAKKMLQDFFDD